MSTAMKSATSAEFSANFENWRTGYGEAKLEIYPALQKAITALGPEGAAEVYLRASQAYNKGVKEPIEGQALFATNFDFTKLLNSYLQIDNDMQTLNELKELVAAKKAMTVLQICFKKFSPVVQKQLVEEFKIRGDKVENWANIAEKFKWDDKDYKVTAMHPVVSPANSKSSEKQNTQKSAATPPNSKSLSQQPAPQPALPPKNVKSSDKQNTEQQVATSTNQKASNKQPAPQQVPPPKNANPSDKPESQVKKQDNNPPKS